MYTIFC